MRILAMLAASAHICLAACQTAPGSLLPPAQGPGSVSPRASPAPKPYMRCVTDFWGNCTGVVSNRHAYRWRYVRPGTRPRALRESATARENAAARDTEVPVEKAAVREHAAPREKAAVREKAAPRQKAATREKTPVREAVTPVREAPETKPARKSAPPREKIIMIRDSAAACLAKRRVVGEERPSRDDARRAAENGWMGSVRYDFGERFQDINRAKDVRHVCGPSSISAVLKTPHFRCVVEATPCRDTTGAPVEPVERRYDRVQEDQISRK